MALLISRRGFLSFLAAPAIVHAGNLMPIKPWLPPIQATWRMYNQGVPFATDQWKYLEGLSQRTAQILIYGDDSPGPSPAFKGFRL